MSPSCEDFPMNSVRQQFETVREYIVQLMNKESEFLIVQLMNKESEFLKTKLIKLDEASNRL